MVFEAWEGGWGVRPVPGLFKSVYVDVHGNRTVDGGW
jgi:hypothetical protein